MKCLATLQYDKYMGYHSLCYTSCGSLDGMRNSSMGPPWRIDPMIHRNMSECSYHRATSRSEWMNGWMNKWMKTFMKCLATLQYDKYMGYSFWLAAILLYAPSHRQDSTYHSLCYTSCGSLDGTRNSSMGPPWGIDPTTNSTMSGCSTIKLHRLYVLMYDYIYVLFVCRVWLYIHRCKRTGTGD